MSAAGRRLRLEGVAPSVEARLKGLRELLAASGAKMEELGTLESRAFWREVRDVVPLEPAADAHRVEDLLPADRGSGHRRPHQGATARPKAFYDWSGGLIWLALPASADADHEIVRGALGLAAAMRRSCARRNGACRGAGIPAAVVCRSPRWPAREGKLRSQGRSSIRGGWAAMQTNFTLAQLADPETARSEQILRKCVHCGFCTATCPTFVLLGDERDSPRGRIYFIKAMLEGDRAPTHRRCATSIAACRACPA